MSKKPATSGLPADKAVATEAIAADSVKAGPDESPTSHKKKRHRGILLALLLIIALAGGLAFRSQLQPLLHAWIDRFPDFPTQQAQKEEPEDATPAPTPEPGSAQEPPASETEPVTQAPAPRPQQARSQPATEELGGLLDTIDELRGELRQMTEAQQALRDGLHEQQRMNLQVRLRWISDPGSRLPQLKLAWEEISLLPGLTDEERDRSIKMQALARADMQKLRRWKETLVKWADAMSTPVHADIMPRPEHPWLAWAVGQFHLRRAPAEESRRLSRLRRQLLDSVRLLTLEAWPASGYWQGLRAELLLNVRALQQENERSAAAIELGLPDNFAAIQADIKLLRQTAHQWQGEL